MHGVDFRFKNRKCLVSDKNPDRIWCISCPDPNRQEEYEHHGEHLQVGREVESLCGKTDGYWS